MRRDHAFSWAATENVVWQGHDAVVELDAGPATIALVAGPQPEPAARRHVDAILLTPDEADVARRIATEGYLPLDGLLTVKTLCMTVKGRVRLYPFALCHPKMRR